MERRTREVTVILRPDNIVETTINEGITELALERVEEVLEATNEVYRLNDEPKAALICAPSFYIKKDVLKGYAANQEVEAVAVAILTPSFASKIIGNLLLTIRGRILALNNNKMEPSKVFREKETAVKWLLEHLSKVKK